LVMDRLATRSLILLVGAAATVSAVARWHTQSLGGSVRHRTKESDALSAESASIARRNLSGSALTEAAAIVPDIWTDRANRPTSVPLRIRPGTINVVSLDPSLVTAFEGAELAREKGGVDATLEAGRLVVRLDPTDDGTMVDVYANFGRLPCGRYRFGDCVVVLAEPRLVPIDLPPLSVGRLYCAAIPHEHFRNPVEWKLVEGKLPAGLIVKNGGFLSGVVAHADGTYRFTIEATDDDGQIARGEYAIDTMTSGISPLGAHIEDVNRDRTAGPGDRITISFDGIVKLRDAETEPRFRLLPWPASLGTDYRVEAGTEDQSIDIMLGAAACCPFEIGLLMLTSDGNGLLTADGRSTGPIQMTLMDQPPVRSFYWMRGETVVELPITRFDPVNPRINVKGLPGDLNFRDGRIGGMVAPGPTVEGVFEAELDGYVLGRMSFRIGADCGTERPTLECVSERTVEVGSLLRLRVGRVAASRVRVWLNDVELDCELPAPPGCRYVFVPEEASSGALRAFGEGGMSDATPITVRNRASAARLPQTTATEILETMVDGRATTFLVFRGSRLRGTRDGRAPRFKLGSKSAECFILESRFGAIRIPDEVGGGACDLTLSLE